MEGWKTTGNEFRGFMSSFTFYASLITFHGGLKNDETQD